MLANLLCLSNLESSSFSAEVLADIYFMSFIQYLDYEYL